MRMIKLQSYSCPHCGASLKLNANSNTVHCEFCDADIVLKPSQLPALPYDETALKKWKKLLILGNVFLTVCIVIYCAMVFILYHPEGSTIPLGCGCLTFLVVPFLLGMKKPPDRTNQKHVKLDIISCYLIFLADAVVSYLVMWLIDDIIF